MSEKRRIELIVSVLALIFIILPFSEHISSVIMTILYFFIVLLLSVLIYYLLIKIKFIYKLRGIGGAFFVFALLFFKNHKITNHAIYLLIISFLISNIIIVIRKNNDFFE